MFFLLDDTGSFQTVGPRWGGSSAALVEDLEAALPGVEFGFGVGRFEDYGADLSAAAYGEGVRWTEGRPFILNQPIVTAGDAGGSESATTLVGAALARTAPGYGGDGPETGARGPLPGRHRTRLRRRRRRIDDGIEDVQPAGSAEAQAAARRQRRRARLLDPRCRRYPRSGSVGGAGFRPDALRLVVLATDICTVTAFDPGWRFPNEVSGVGDPVPVTEFACSCGRQNASVSSPIPRPGANQVEGAVVPSGGATLPATVAALTRRHPRAGPVLASGASSPSASRLGPSDDPSVYLSALALLTGAVDDEGNPLVFDIDAAGSSLKDAIVAAVVAATTTTTVDVVLAPARIGPGRADGEQRPTGRPGRLRRRSGLLRGHLPRLRRPERIVRPHVQGRRRPALSSVPSR